MALGWIGPTTAFGVVVRKPYTAELELALPRTPRVISRTRSQLRSMRGREPSYLIS
jgi:hypothetical protein